jgi:hypothetical protein
VTADAPVLLPREHGAYGQLIVPLATAAGVAGVTAPALLLGLATTAGFLAHEPLLVILGRRGVRARREAGRRAALWLVLLATAGLAAGASAAIAAHPDVRWAFALPLVPAAALGWAIARGVEKSTPGEVAAALAFSLTAVPMCLLAGESLPVAVTVAAPLGLMFVGQTFAVRAVILRVRGGGDPKASAGSRLAAIGVSVTGIVVLAVLALAAVLPWPAAVAALPGTATTLTIAARPPSPARLRMVGWTLVAASVTTAAILIGVASF